MCIEIPSSRQTGMTLLEQIVFIIVVSVGVIGVLSVMGPTLRYSADPQVKKQQQAIAESLLSEILHQPFTYCDPDDANAISATGTADCTVSQDNLAGASPNTESRFGLNPTTQFDNVADYAGYSQTGVTGLSSPAISGYTASVAITRAGGAYSLPDGAVLRIDVMITSNSADPLTLTGYRFRYAPRY